MYYMCGCTKEKQLWGWLEMISLQSVGFGLPTLRVDRQATSNESEMSRNCTDMDTTNPFPFPFPCAASAVKRAASQFEFMSIQRVHSQGHVSRAHTH